MEWMPEAESSPRSGWHPAQTRHGLHIRSGVGPESQWSWLGLMDSPGAARQSQKQCISAAPSTGMQGELLL